MNTPPRKVYVYHMSRYYAVPWHEWLALIEYAATHGGCYELQESWELRGRPRTGSAYVGVIEGTSVENWQAAIANPTVALMSFPGNS